MKKIKNSILVLLLAGLGSTFGQTTLFIENRDGYVETIVANKFLLEIQQDLSKIYGTTSQQWEACQNPGKRIFIGKKPFERKIKWENPFFFGVSVEGLNKDLSIRYDGKNLTNEELLSPYSSRRSSIKEDGIGILVPILIALFYAISRAVSDLKRRKKKEKIYLSLDVVVLTALCFLVYCLGLGIIYGLIVGFGLIMIPTLVYRL